MQNQNHGSGVWDIISFYIPGIPAGNFMGEEGTAMRMVLCETEESRRTYTLNSFGQTISSYEELCYIISGQYLYFLTEGIPEGMREWIEEELGLVLPAEEETKKQLEHIISYRNYFTVPEQRMLVQQMRTAYLYSSVRKTQNARRLISETFQISERLSRLSKIAFRSDAAEDKGTAGSFVSHGTLPDPDVPFSGGEGVF